MSTEPLNNQQQTPPNILQKQQQQLLKILQNQISTLRYKMSSYGISTTQFKQCMYNDLSNILYIHMNKFNKDKLDKQRENQKQHKNIKQQEIQKQLNQVQKYKNKQRQKQKEKHVNKNMSKIMQQINTFINKKPHRAVQLIKDIVNSIDQQINQLQSEPYSQQNIEKQKNASKTCLKIEGKRAQYQHNAQSQKQMNNDLSIQDQLGLAYVKLQHIDEANWQMLFQNNQISPQVETTKRRGRSAAKSKKSTSYKFN